MWRILQSKLTDVNCHQTFPDFRESDDQGTLFPGKRLVREKTTRETLCMRRNFLTIAKLANLSMQTWKFPSKYRQTQVLSMLKKAGLDRSSPENYKPISNLSTDTDAMEQWRGGARPIAIINWRCVPIMRCFNAWDEQKILFLVSARWPPTRRPRCKLDLWVLLYRLL